MTVLATLELIAALFTAALFVCVLILAVAIHIYGTPALLDGRPLGSALDDSDRARLIDAADARLTTLVELNQTWDLPTREPRA
jgi:hypothetical protein